MKNMFFIFFSLALIGLEGEISAQDFSIKTGAYSKYLGKPGILFYDGPVLINDITVSYHDWYADLTTFTGLERKASLGDLGDEIDLGVGWHHAYDWVKLDGRLSYYMLNKLGRNDDDRWIVDLRADFVRCPIVQPYVAARYFGSFTTKILEGGWFGWVGVKRTQPLDFLPSFTDKPVALTADASIAYSDGALHRTAGSVYSRLGITMDVPLSKKVTLSPSVLWQIPTDDDRNRSRSYTTGKTETVFGLTLITKF